MIPYHRVTGPEDAPVLVLSNSLGATLKMWDPQARALARKFRLVRYDTRGHGRSDTPPGPYSIDDAGRDVLDLLDHLQVERAHFAGLSLGGMTGIWLGINAPERVDRLVLLCTSPKMGPADLWIDRAKTVRENGTEAIVDGTFERWFTADYRAGHDLTPWREMFVGVDDEGYASCCGIIEKMDQTDGLPHVKAPTLVIAGAQDPATPPDDHGAVIAGAIPHARLEVVDPGAHLLNVERPDVVTDLIREHLS
ncbi:3-oxoadipate enol-lactonase [Solirubrobacter sp. CPCC 204708]|uniref:3-oxoadipate enol-lactonase n=1 Tax=Solirubrobacter deserti TaxID=2282478 RepID=A0ABT4RLT2_9ACTN|nr:3-oxoadipate enol-lactonase [Solirubrobacter deserti]MBE2316723.1 3-oxoadipate enol-lactonase [Solirubrobacter deserti]MDA0139479.1 3-oxoadipate enol-lactonase [Solirubrobacter deserti]